VLDDAEFDALTELNRPVGLLGLERDGFLSARIDDVESARTAVDHLVGLGHARVALIGGDTDDPMAFTPPLHRRDGYREALQAAGLPTDPDLEHLGYFTVEGGREAARHLLSLADRPTAIFAESDEMAYGALREIRDAGLCVPKDVAVIGFDDQPLSELMDLSTIRQPVVDQALDITTRLLALINEDGDELPRKPGVVLPTELVVRGSTVTAP
ncbi:MAG TPA: substrate-binding domain-containing protein, partial [Jatrophihabitans sp.]|nr:substrate-binding domain-containing protein [Jatrophihabitans sp.]